MNNWDQLRGMEIVTKLECLDFSKDYVLTLTQIECGYPGWEARPVDDFFGGATFCNSTITCVQAWLDEPTGEFGATRFEEMVKDAIGSSLEGFDYNDAINSWFQQNPFLDANQISGLCPAVIACVQTAPTLTLKAVTVDSINVIGNATIAGDLSVTGDITADDITGDVGTFNTLNVGSITLPAGTALFTQDSTPRVVGGTYTTTNTLGLSGTILSSVVNGVTANRDLGPLIASMISSSSDSVTNTLVSGFKVATHIAVNGTLKDIFVPVATLTPTTNGYTYTAIDNTTTSVVYDVIDQATPNPKLTITVGGTLVKTIDLNQNDIQINNAGSDFNLVDDILTFLETNGDSATISFAKYNVSVTVQPNGDQLIYQNGNLLATVYKNAIDIAYNNTVSGLTATNTQAAIDQLASLIASGAFTVSDTASIDLTKSLTGNISANVIISPDSCNQLQSLANGLYVAPNTVFETSTANWATDLANIPGGTYLKNNENGDFVYKKCNGDIVAIVDNMILGAENGLYVAGNSKIRRGGNLIEQTVINTLGFTIQYLMTNGKSVSFYPDGNVEIGREFFVNQGPTANSNGKVDIGSKNPGDNGGIRGVKYADSNGTLTGEPLEVSERSYPRDSAGNTIAYHEDSSVRYDPITFEHTNKFANSKDRRYQIGNTFGERPLNEAGVATEKVMLFDEANNLVKISNSPLRKEFIIDSINTTPNTFVQMTNANFDATVGGYDYYKIVSSTITMPDVMYPAPAGERWVMDIDYSEQQATEDAINASYSYCYFQNIGIHIKEGNLSDIVVGDSVTFANRRMRVNLNNTGNTFRVVRFQRLKSGLTMYASGGYTEYQYNNATITYKCIPIV